MQITLITHSCTLVEGGGVRALVDPLFGLGGPLEGRVQPAIRAQDLADVDLVLVTHAHPDHLDPGFFALTQPDLPVLVPAGFEWPEWQPPLEAAEELTLWESRSFTSHGEDLTVTCVPATHGGLSCGYVVEADDCALYIAGDTHLDEAMREIGERWTLDLALLPERPRPDIPVLDVAEAVAATAALHPSAVAFYHRGYGPPVDGIVEPGDEYVEALQAETPDVSVTVAEPGETLVV